MKNRKTNIWSFAARSSNCLGLCSITFSLFSAGQVLAQNVWSGANSSNWNDVGNWSLGIPVDNQALTFNGSPPNTIAGPPQSAATNNDLTALTVGNIVFSNSGPGAGLTANQFNVRFQLTGNPIILTGNITGNSATQPGAGTSLINITDIINLDVSLKANSIFNFTNTSAGATGVQHFLTVNGLISETGGVYGITKNGSGSLTLSNPANSFTGSLTVTNGTTSVSALAVSGLPSSIGSGTELFLSGGILNFNGSTAPAVFNRQINLTVNSTLQNNGSTAFAINGAFNHTGGNKLLTLGGSTTATPIDVQSSLVDSATLGILTISKNDSGSWTLSGNNTYTGPTLVTNGTLSISKVADAGLSSIGYFLGDSANAGLRLGNLGSTGNLIYTGSGGSTNRTVQIGNSASPPASANTGGANIKNNGAGPLVFGANPFNLRTEAITGVGANRILNIGGTNTGANEITGTIRDNIVTAPATGTAIVGLTKSDAGRWILAGTNTYTGTTLVSGGVLQLGSASALPAGGTLTLGGGVIGLGSGNFTRALGTGPDQVALTATGAGFAAYGADRIVNFSSAPSSLIWSGASGTPGFFTAGGDTLVLGSSSSTHTVDFQNSITLSAVRFFRTENGAAVVDGRLSGAITGSSSFSKAGTGTLELTNIGNAWAGNTFVDSGTLRLGASGVLPPNLTIVKRGNLPSNTSGLLDLNGFDETIGALSLGEADPDISNVGQTPSVINSGSVAVLTLGGVLTYVSGPGTGVSLNGQATISANIATGIVGSRNIVVGNGSATDDLVISGELTGGAITKQGPGTLALANAKYTGNTTVSQGTVTLSTANPNNDASTVTIATSGATLNLTYAGTDVVTSLVIGTDPPLANGIYGGTAGPGVTVLPQLAGTGTLTVGIPSDLYLSWSGGVPFDGDANNDGVQNGLAWLLGAASPSVSALGLLPTIIQSGGSLQMNFSMLNAASRGAAAVDLQHSGDLGISDPWTGVVVPNINGGPTSGVTFIITPGIPLNGVQATISSSEAAGGKLFGRLKGLR